MAAEFTLVIPGKSTRVKLRTLGEKIFRFMASGLIPWKTRKQYQNRKSKYYFLIQFQEIFIPYYHPCLGLSLIQSPYGFPENL